MLDTSERATYSLSLTGRVEMHGGSYISFCNELPLIGVGETSEAAMNSFLTCVNDYLRMSIEWEILHEVMEDYGITPPKPSVNITTGNFAMNLPGVFGGMVIGEGNEALAVAQ